MNRSKAVDRLNAAALPWPLFLTASAAIERGNHQELMEAWEALVRVPAAAVWATVRSLGLSSDAFEAQCSKLRSPAFGTWVGLLREGARLLAKDRNARLAGLEPLLDALERSDKDLPGAADFRRATRTHSRGLFKGNDNRNVMGLLEEVVAWRNACEHRIEGAVGDAAAGEGPLRVEEDVRALVAPSLAALLAEVAVGLPLLGEAKVFLVTERRADGEQRLVEGRVLHGQYPCADTLALSASAWDRVRECEVYLRTPDDRLLPMAPTVVVQWHGERWLCGWMKECRRSEVLAATTLWSGAAGTFRVAVDAVAVARLTPEPEKAEFVAPPPEECPQGGCIKTHAFPSESTCSR